MGDVKRSGMRMPLAWKENMTSAGKAFLEFANSTELIVSAKEFSANPSAAKLYLKQLFSGTVSLYLSVSKKNEFEKVDRGMVLLHLLLDNLLDLVRIQGLINLCPLAPVGRIQVVWIPTLSSHRPHGRPGTTPPRG